MEEEDEQEDPDQEEVEAEQQPHSPSDLGGVPWKEAVELHTKLRGDAADEGEGESLADAVSRDGEMDEEEEEEDDEDEDEEESSDGKWMFLLVTQICTCWKCNLFLFCILSSLHL